MSKDRLYLESIRNLEVIGEATKNLSEDLRDANPSIPWRQIAGMRDVLIHDYLKVNLNRVWRTVEIDLPPLDTVAVSAAEGVCALRTLAAAEQVDTGSAADRSGGRDRA